MIDRSMSPWYIFDLDNLEENVRSFANLVLASKTMAAVVDKVTDVLIAVGVRPPYPDAEQIGLTITATIGTLLTYYIFFGNRHHQRRKKLQTELLAAQKRVAMLQDKLVEAEVVGDNDLNGRVVRIWMDGAFDMMHYGHMNAFRQGRALGTQLVVGVNSDASIKECKGPPVMNEGERLMAVKGCKWVDEVVENVPYIMNEEYLQYVIKQYKIDYVVHGDDPCIVNGKDVYDTAKSMGKYRTVPRTEGVSTTDIVGRMLLRSREHHNLRDGVKDEPLPRLASTKGKKKVEAPLRSQFLTTSRMLRLFSAGVKAPPSGAKVVYIDGAWDMFHAGHVAILKEARKFGDYLIAGVHGDDVVNKRRGLNMPVMNLNERVLSVLGCAYVDDVLIDAPPAVTREMLASLSVCAVVHGTVDDNREIDVDSSSSASGEEDGENDSIEKDDGYALARSLGIFHTVVSPSNLTVMEIIGRIQKNQEVFEKKFAKKKKAEDDYYKGRYNLSSEDVTK